MSSRPSDLEYHHKHVELCFNTQAPGVVGEINVLFYSTAKSLLARFEQHFDVHTDAQLSIGIANLIIAKDAAVRAILIATKQVQ